MNDTPPENFDSFYLSDDLLRALKEIEYFTPTPVQASSIPLIMAGIDLIVQSQTGTGKTAAFGIPVIDMLDANAGCVEVLVLAPTRELAQQVSKEFSRLSHFKKIESTAIYGGTSYGPQVEALKTAQIVCATPGRLLDLLNQGKIKLDSLRFLILDEADEMLSMGFERELSSILEFLPEERQSLLFSATVTEEIKALSNNMLFYPEFLSFSSDSVVNTDVTHTYFYVEGMGRVRDLVRVIEFESPDNAIIFANTKSDTFMINSYLQRLGYRAEVLNGDLAQAEREKTLLALREGKIDFLVATDVAARGIDISELTHVFNFTIPETPEVYVHRTGRTGRAGNKGSAISLISPAEMTSFLQIKKHCEVELHQRHLPTTDELIEAKRTHALRLLHARIAEREDLAYGAKLGLAQNLLNSLKDDVDQDERTLFLAKVLTLAELATSSASPSLSTLAKVPGHTPQEVAQVAQVAQVAHPVSSTKVEPTVQATQDTAEEKAARTPRSSNTSDKDDSKNERAARRGSRQEPQKLHTQKPSTRPTKTLKSNELGAPTLKPQRRKPRPRHHMSRMYLNVGKNEFNEDNVLLDVLIQMAGMDDTDFGQITLERSHSFIEVRKDYLYDVIDALDNQDWEGTTFHARPARK